MRGKVNQLLSVVVWWGSRCKLWYGPHKAGELKNGWSELVALRVQASRDNLLAARLLPQRIIDAACFRAFHKKIIPEGANGRYNLRTRGQNFAHILFTNCSCQDTAKSNASQTISNLVFGPHLCGVMVVEQMRLRSFSWNHMELRWPYHSTASNPTLQDGPSVGC